MQIIKSDTENGVLVCEFSIGELEQFSVDNGGRIGIDLQAIVDYVAAEDSNGFGDVLDGAESLMVNVSANSPTSVIVQINAGNGLTDSMQESVNSFVENSSILPLDLENADTEHGYGAERGDTGDANEVCMVGYEFPNMERTLEAAMAVDDSSSFSSALAKVKDGYLLILGENTPESVRLHLEEYGDCSKVTQSRFEFFREHDCLRMEHDAIGFLKRFA